jgi:lipopolysaccharide export system protein LptA
MEGFDKEKYVLFKGSVIAKQEDLFIFSDTMEAYMNETTNEIEKAVAKGNVKIVKLDRTATCREATFENAKGEITLKGNVVVYQGKDKLSGDTIIYYVNEDKVVVQSEKNSKAHITVQPKNQ